GGIGGSSDQFNFIGKTMSGDGTVVARVNLQSNTDPSAQSGIMIRADDSAGAMFAAVVVTPGNGVQFQYRLTQGGQVFSTQVPGGALPRWVRIDRSGNMLTAMTSSDGNAWT